jgi:isopentenyl phosphate kinase
MFGHDQGERTGPETVDHGGGSFRHLANDFFQIGKIRQKNGYSFVVRSLLSLVQAHYGMGVEGFGTDAV